MCAAARFMGRRAALHMFGLEVEVKWHSFKWLIKSISINKQPKLTHWNYWWPILTFSGWRDELLIRRKVWTLLLRWDPSGRGDFIMKVTAEEYLPVMFNGCVQQTTTCSSSSSSSGEPDKCHIFKMKAWIFKSAQLQRSLAKYICHCLLCFRDHQTAKHTTLHCTLSQGRQLFFTNTVFFNCWPMLSCYFYLFYDKTRYNCWALFVLFCFCCSTRRRSAMRWTWSGGSSLWRSPWSSTRGWSVKHWLSSRAIVRGWRTCSSAPRLRWALARVRERADSTSSIRPSALIACMFNARLLSRGRGASS